MLRLSELPVNLKFHNTYKLDMINNLLKRKNKESLSRTVYDSFHKMMEKMRLIEDTFVEISAISNN